MLMVLIDVSGARTRINSRNSMLVVLSHFLMDVPEWVPFYLFFRNGKYLQQSSSRAFPLFELLDEAAAECKIANAAE